MTFGRWVSFGRNKKCPSSFPCFQPTSTPLQFVGRKSAKNFSESHKVDSKVLNNWSTHYSSDFTANSLSFHIMFHPYRTLPSPNFHKTTYYALHSHDYGRGGRKGQLDLWESWKKKWSWTKKTICNKQLVQRFDRKICFQVEAATAKNTDCPNYFMRLLISLVPLWTEGKL